MSRRVLLPALLTMLACGACSQSEDAAVDEPSVSTTVGTSATSTTAEPITIMPVGCSFTQGATGWSTYRCYLDAMLHDAGVSFDFVGTRSEPHGGEPYGCPTDFDQDHEGWWGTSIGALADRATESVKVLQPDVALVYIGGNDLGANKEPVGVAEELESFITGLQAVSPDITVLVAQIIPCDMPLPKCTDGVAAFNAAVASFASLSTGESSVVVVDFATGFDPDYYRDAVHVTDAGDEFLAGRWMAALEDSGVIATWSRWLAVSLGIVPQRFYLSSFSVTIPRPERPK